MKRSIAILMILPIFLSGCGLLEYLWLVPRAQERVKFDPDLTNEEIFTAVERAALAPELHALNRLDVSRRDVDKGLIELGPFRESNVAGYAVRAMIDRPESQLTLVVKGAGPYYSHLPVKESARHLAQDLSNALAKRQ